MKLKKEDEINLNREIFSIKIRLKKNEIASIKDLALKNRRTIGHEIGFILENHILERKLIK